MKKLIVFIIAFILTACLPSASQVTVTPEVTVTSSPPPTETPIPTPTFHPQFTALQNEIVNSSTRFTLQADGLIYDGETPIPGISVAPDGRMSLTVNGETVTLAPDTVNFGEEGIEVDGYELNDDGEWVEAISEAKQHTDKILEENGVDLKTVTLSEEGGAVNVVDNETGKVLMRTIGNQTKYDLAFGVDSIAANSCQPTNFESSKYGSMRGEYVPVYLDDLEKIINELEYKETNGAKSTLLLINREKNCWGFLYGNKDLLYRDGEGIAREMLILPIKKAEIDAFKISR
jgi:hypothetical protein